MKSYITKPESTLGFGSNPFEGIYG